MCLQLVLFILGLILLIDIIFFFNDIKYQGKRFGVKGNQMINYPDNAKLFEIMKNAKSIYINVRDPNKPFDPNR